MIPWECENVHKHVIKVTAKFASPCGTVSALTSPTKGDYVPTSVITKSSWFIRVSFVSAQFLFKLSCDFEIFSSTHYPKRNQASRLGSFRACHPFQRVTFCRRSFPVAIITLLVTFCFSFCLSAVAKSRSETSRENLVFSIEPPARKNNFIDAKLW